MSENKLIFERLNHKIFDSEVAPIKIFSLEKLVGMQWGELMARFWKLQNECGKNTFFLLGIHNAGHISILPDPSRRIVDGDELILNCFLGEKWECFEKEIVQMGPVFYLPDPPGEIRVGITEE